MLEKEWGSSRWQARLFSTIVVYLLFQFELTGFVYGFSLSSSPSSEDGHVTVCPHTNVTITCTASQVATLAWRDHNELIGLFIVNSSRLIRHAPYTLTLATVDNVTGSAADLISTLEVVVDGTVSGANISCEIFRNQRHLILYLTSAPSPPSNVIVQTNNFLTDNFSIIISWEESGDEVVDEYRILTNTTNQSISTTSTTAVLEGKYNIPLEIRVSATNCAGTSAEVTEEVIVAGCGPPSPPVNGSVGEWTSSRVGAQVTYSCDTDLVLVGERVATCSLPSLQWLPSSDDVICEPPSTKTISITPSTSPATATPATPTAPSTSAGSAGVPIAVAVVVPLVCVGAIGALIFLLVLLYRHRLKNWKVSRVVEDNCYDGQEMLMRPGSSTGTVSLSTSHSPPPRSPLDPSATTSRDTAPFYSQVPSTAESSGNGTTTSTAMYSETTNSMRAVVVSHDGHGVATSHQRTQEADYCTAHHKNTTSQPQSPEKYAELSFQAMRSPLPSLEEPVQYSELQLSTKQPPRPPRPEPYGSSQPGPSGDKHPLDQKITIDMAIQQLQRLTPHWWEVGEAAGIQRPTLKEIAAHFKGNERESFSEVMNLVFMPSKTTWTELAGVCDRAGFTDLAEALLDSYSTGVLPVQIEEDKDTLRLPPSEPAPPVPPRGAAEEDLPPSLPPPLTPRGAVEDDLPPSLPPPLTPRGTTEDDLPPSLPPPLAPEDLPLALPPSLPPFSDVPPPRPRKAGKPPAIPPRH